MATTVEDVDIEGLSDVEVTMDFTNFTSPEELSKTVEAFFNNSQDREPTKDHTALIIRYPKEYFAIDEVYYIKTAVAAGLAEISN